LLMDACEFARTNDYHAGSSEMAGTKLWIYRCCVLVGQMKTALLEIREQYRPDRIIIECSGSAFPATLAFQLRELEKETEGDLKMDAIVTVIDAENFIGYEDTSPTARMQASYTDMILINKWELVSDRELDTVLDHLHTLNDLTPKIRVSREKGVDPAVIFGLDTKLFSGLENEHKHGPLVGDHNEEVQTATVYRGPPKTKPWHSHEHGSSCECVALKLLPKESIWRVKGFVRFSSGEAKILNWAFGRHELTSYIIDEQHEIPTAKLTVMGQRGEMKRFVHKFANKLGAEIEHIS